ncbi:MAG: hypothetical protein ACR2L2_12995 [Acidobacteriota bacterium]
MTPAKKGSLNVFDPRKGEDYLVEVAGGTTISTLANHLLVVTFYPELPSQKVTVPLSLSFRDLNAFVTVSMQRLGKLGVFTIAPLTRETRQSEVAAVDQVSVLLGSAIGYFDLDGGSIERHLQLRQRLASYAEWVIGSCDTTFVEPKEPKWYQRAIFWDSQLLFTQIANVQCLSVFYGETGDLLFFTRLYEGIDKWLKPLLAKVADPSV